MVHIARDTGTERGKLLVICDEFDMNKRYLHFLKTVRTFHTDL
jgi:hypothetical protein